MTPKYKIHFINFGYCSSHEPETLEEAKKVASRAGFQSNIIDPYGNVVVSFCPLDGFREPTKTYST